MFNPPSKTIFTASSLNSFVNTLFGNFSILTPPFWYDKLTLVSTKSIIPHPIIYSVRAGNNPVEEAGAGITIEPYNHHQLDQAIRKLIIMGAEGRKQLGAKGKKYALENLEWSVLGKNYETLCRSLIDGAF
jgi:hypothetical protein